VISWHARENGDAFKIQVDSDGNAILYVSNENKDSLPDEVEGAYPCTEEEGDEEETPNVDDEIDLLIAALGKTSAEIREMGDEEKLVHAAACDKSRTVKASALNLIMEKVAGPPEIKTKLGKLEWLFITHLE
jgi:hypothetical protein